MIMARSQPMRKAKSAPLGYALLHERIYAAKFQQFSRRDVSSPRKATLRGHSVLEAH